MTPPTARIRLRLYGAAVAGLATAAIIGLCTLGDSDPSTAAGPPRPTHATQHPTSTAGTVTRSRTSPTGSTTPTPRTSAPSSAHPTEQPTSRPTSTPATARPKIYTVRPGDNLTVIARWFHLRGYAPLYDWNKTVIGQNPNLIFPGQQIIVAPGGQVSVTRHR